MYRGRSWGHHMPGVPAVCSCTFVWLCAQVWLRALFCSHSSHRFLSHRQLDLVSMWVGKFFHLNGAWWLLLARLPLTTDTFSFARIMHGSIISKAAFPSSSISDEFNTVQCATFNVPCITRAEKGYWQSSLHY